MEQLVKKRDVIRNLFSRTLKIVDLHHDASQILTTSKIVKHLEHLNKSWNDLTTIQNKIDEKAENIETQFCEHEISENIYFDVTSKLEEIKESLVVPPIVQLNSNINEPLVNLSLPKMELPKFYGDPNEWQSFFSVFKTTVHNNQSISKVLKFAYLRSAISGEALKLINAFPITEDCYEQVIETLQSRYESKRKQVWHYLNILTKIQIMKDCTAAGLINLFDRSNEVIRNLIALGYDTNKEFEAFMVWQVSGKFDSSTAQAWELSLENQEIPTIDQLMQFLEKRSSSLAVTENNDTIRARPVKRSLAAHASEVSYKCILCNQAHRLFKCPKFNTWNQAQRFSFTASKQLCRNCLAPGHQSSVCSSNGRCRKCNAKHNTLLHSDFRSPQADSSKPSYSQVQANDTNSSSLNPAAIPFTASSGMLSASASVYDQHQWLLCTALINVQKPNGDYLMLRALLDGGSQINFITEQAVQSLNLATINNRIFFNTVGNVPTASNSSVILNFKSLYSNELFTCQSNVIPSISSDLPSNYSKAIYNQSINKLQLADKYYNMPSQIDILLGAEMLFKISFAMGAPAVPISKNLVAHYSKLGYVLFGKIKIHKQENPVSCLSLLQKEDINLQRFWELEAVPQRFHLTPEEKLCEDHFSENTTRDQNGRYIVKLPRRLPKEALGDTLFQATQRFLLMEEKFKKNAQKRLYSVHGRISLFGTHVTNS